MQPASGGNLLNSAVVGRLQWPQDRESQPHNDEIHPCGGDEHYVLAADKKGGCVWTCGPPNTPILAPPLRNRNFADSPLEETVSCELVSLSEFPVRFGAPSAEMAPDNRAISVLYEAIPYALEQGI